MRSRTALLAVALLVVAAGIGAYVLFLRGDNVAPLALPSAKPLAVAGPAAGSSQPSGGASLGPAASAPIDAASLPGTWTIGSGSVAGYRVRERLANLSADSDAVGRTEQITGTATLTASGSDLTVSAADFSVDMTTITSDRAMRDNRLRTDGIETDAFPTSTFSLTEPLAVPAEAASGVEVDITLHGDLFLHGVKKAVDIPAKAQLTGTQIQIAGSLKFPFSDFAINPPSVGGFVTVEAEGTLEFLVILTKS